MSSKLIISFLHFLVYISFRLQESQFIIISSDIIEGLEIESSTDTEFGYFLHIRLSWSRLLYSCPYFKEFEQY